VLKGNLLKIYPTLRLRIDMTRHSNTSNNDEEASFKFTRAF